MGHGYVVHFAFVFTLTSTCAIRLHTLHCIVNHSVTRGLHFTSSTYTVLMTSAMRRNRSTHINQMSKYSQPNTHLNA